MSARSASSKGYDPKPVESEMYRLWTEGGYFHHAPGRPGDGNDYCIMIPLPNVTGALHLGHALNHTCQDIMIRRARMQGKTTLWMTGTDHAGIATQSVVERRLFEQENKTRHDLGREALVRRIWQWKDQYEQRILSQMKLLGNSCDWERTRFTLDDVCARAVRHTFFRMFKDGLIYRGRRLVNWDTQLQTAVSDDEVYHERLQSHLWHMRYPIAGHSATAPGVRPGRDYLVVATTRPETMLGDTAVAVHPDDPRYKDLIGKTCILPLMDREIPIIADPVLVRMEFGSGCVKVTPAHDPNDYECGLRNGLEMINILTPDGKINVNGGRFDGMDRPIARGEVVAALEAAGLMEKIEPYEHEVGHSDRSKTAIEPYLSEQWFVKMDDIEGGVKLADGTVAQGLAQAAIDAVNDGRVRFFPERYAKTYLDWLGEKRDWCISRQLWWGHRIPVWYATGCDEAAIRAAFADRDDVAARYDEANDRWLICVREGELSADGLPGARVEQDDDVLDTWFSSALWPHSTLGWPDETDELKYWYPGSVLITSRDIITLWVARMVMTGLYNIGPIPFHHVYVHPKILDGQGQTMSKSKGNGVDPVEIIDRYGADATRFSIAYMTTETQDVRMPVAYVCPHCDHLIPQKPEHRTQRRMKCPSCKQAFQPSSPLVEPDPNEPIGIVASERFEVGRNLCNKLWQASTGFVLRNLDGYEPCPLEPDSLDLQDRWILSRLTECIEKVDAELAVYRYAESVMPIYRFFWNDFCDWYVEMTKLRLQSDGPEKRVAQQVLAWVLDQALRLLHPYVPFVTEALWRQLNAAAPKRGITEPVEHSPVLVVAAWPTVSPAARDAKVELDMEKLQAVIRAIRDIRARVNDIRSQAKQPSVRTLPEAIIKAAWDTVDLLARNADFVKLLATCDALAADTDCERPAASAVQVIDASTEVYVPIGDLIDLAKEKERLQGELANAVQQIKQITGKLANEKFVTRAKPEIVQRERDRLAEFEARRDSIAENLSSLG
ncbi:MAG: valine--tRNA ligase [Phycisphaerae bacterium]|nr:valine--tRNA ligase [Phycisphaerae bacterium]